MTTLSPRLTLSEVFGPGVVYVSRRSPTLHGWSPPAPGHVDYQTGTQLTVAGGIPYVVSAGVATPAALDVLAEAGLPVDAELHHYDTLAEYLELLRYFSGSGIRLAMQRAHPDAEIPPDSACPHSAVFRRVNDKGHMEDFVPAGWLPERRTLALTDLPAAGVLLADGRPAVLKVSTDAPSGGGHGVWICRTPAEVEEARGLMAGAGEPRAVVEEFLRITRSVCVHGAVFPDGRTTVLGAAEEICREGRWTGNWFDREGEGLPQSVVQVVERIIANAAAIGFRGIAGVDVAFLAEGPPRVLDLNFRVNGSTVGMWLRESIARQTGKTVMMGRGWTGRNGFQPMLAAIRAAVARGTLIPLAIYDPDACTMGGAPRAGGLVLGNSREEVEDEVRRLGAEGMA